MRYLYGKEEDEALDFINKAIEIAKDSSCERSRCGSVIVSGGGKEGKIIGEGYNSPPGDLEEQRRCNVSKDSYDEKVTDKTCCVHAEQRAIMTTLKRNPEKIIGSRLYFVRIDENFELVKAGEPYCTICSKMALDTGIEEFVLFHDRGICVYNTREYNNLSFDYKKK